MAKVSFSGVKKIYPNGFMAIYGMDLDIDDGEFVVLVGPSGCGKSTLLRMLAGLEHVSDGEIRIGDRRVNALEPSERDIAMVFQNYALYPHMSVFNNMAYGLRNKRTPKEEIHRRVEEAAKILEISSVLDRRPRELSGGQRQRVAMGRAIVREPAAFLFDEPLSNLDAKLRVQMRLEIKKLQRKLGTTSIYVTHDQVEAMTMADRLVVMNAGVAEQIGTPLDVYAHPATTFVAGFIGSPAMNFLDAEVDDGGRIHIDGSQTALSASPGSEAAKGQKITLGLRPEDLKPATDDIDALALVVDQVEPLGADSLVHGQLEGSKFMLTVRLPGTAVHPAGTMIRLRVAPDSVHMFDPASGQRIPARA